VQQLDQKDTFVLFWVHKMRYN